MEYKIQAAEINVVESAEMLRMSVSALSFFAK